MTNTWSRSKWLRACFVCVAVAGQFPNATLADGGAIQFSRKCDGLTITLFTSPTPLRAGVVDLSVLVQAADSQSPIVDVPVRVYVHPIDEPQRPLGGPTVVGSAYNRLFHSIQLELLTAGRWQVEIVVERDSHPVRVEGEVELSPPMPQWVDLGVWIGWPIVAIGLFTIHRRLVHRATQRLHSEAGN